MITEIQKQIEQPNSVEISINAKGMYSGKVKVYADIISNAYLKTIEYSNKLEQLIKGKNESD